jgi:hypothetical protein
VCMRILPLNQYHFCFHHLKKFFRINLHVTTVTRFVDFIHIRLDKINLVKILLTKSGHRSTGKL